MPTQGERLATLEAQVNDLSVRMTRLEGKIDSLLELRNKGAGVFWLISILFGTSLIGSFLSVTSWLKG